jgi:hypothetical protein
MPERARRDAAKEQFWRKAIARFSTSGLSRAQFCKQEGLKADTLRYWSEAILERDKERESFDSHSAKQIAKTFLPLTVALPKATDRLAGIQQMAVAEIVVDDCSIRFFNGITSDTVRAVWLALRESNK